MHNNVTRALKRGLLERGFACLRFNFRGTGRSEGLHGDGVAELEDVRAALDFVENLDWVDPERLLIAGYSFGCWVGLRAAAKDHRPVRLVGISPPLDAYDFGFLDNEKRPKLLVTGDRDVICPKEGFEDLVAKIPEPKMTVILPGGDHFYIGRENDLILAINAFLDLYPVEAPRSHLTK